MHIRLNRLKVPLLKGLADIDFQFPSDLLPRVYPIVGKNGSGKSFLLALVYLLLTSANSNGHPYLKILLDGLTCNGAQDCNNTIARIQIDIDGRSLDLLYYAIPYSNLTAGEVEKLNNQINFSRFSSELIESEVVPIYYVDSDYLLLCSFEWQDPLRCGLPATLAESVAGDPSKLVATKIGHQECAKLFNEISRRVFLASRLSEIPHFVANSKTNAATVDRMIVEIPANLPNHYNLDPAIGWWNQPDSTIGASLSGLQTYLQGIYAGSDGSIVLLDNIDAGMDADNQFALATNLQAISPTNQYLVATTSFELCQALTPDHIYST